MRRRRRTNYSPVNISAVPFSFTTIMHFVLILIMWFSKTEMVVAQKKNSMTVIPVNVGVVLDTGGYFGRSGLSCVSMAISDFYSSHPHFKTRLVLHIRNSNNTVIDAASEAQDLTQRYLPRLITGSIVAQDLLKNVKVQAIIGPVSSMQAIFMISLGDAAQVPVISFSATSPSLASLRSPYFVRATLSDSSQVKAISAIVQAYGWRAAVPIYVDNEFGEGIIPFLTDELQEANVRVSQRCVINPLATDTEIAAALYKLMTMQTRVFIVHMGVTLGSRVFAIAKDIGMGTEGYVWIITNGMTNDLSLSDPSASRIMQGVIGIRSYVPKSRKLDDFILRWKRKQEQSKDASTVLQVFGLWAYDATTALSVAVEKLNISQNAINLGKDIRDILFTTKFNGLSGNFHMEKGQLQGSAFEIVNYGRDERVIGYWTEENGIVKALNAKNTNTYSTSKANLEAAIWPGESRSVPKGWVIPTNGKKLRIGVPVKDENSQFVRLIRDSTTNTTTVTGFCIEVFEAVISALPYAVPYEYIPFANHNGESAGSYNDLVYQVFLGNFDAVIGDVTILANRSLYVDFTLPYSESGVTLVVPVKDQKEKNAWVFLKPLTLDLWMATFAFFVWIGIVIWVIEHENEKFGDNPTKQLGTSLWFSFSTMVFAQKERVARTWARFVVIIWCFVVLILTQSYTASLTSLLTYQQLVPTSTTMQELKENGGIIGYPKDSFVIQYLDQANISRRLSYKSRDELDELFSLGSKNGGISAAFDEIPYLKPFLSKYCSKYSMVGPILRADGFGFVFPISSPLVPDVSRAVLKVTEGDKMDQLSRAWFGKLNNCMDKSTSITSTSLNLNSFWGLFLIVGVSSALPLIMNYKTLWNNIISVLRFCRLAILRQFYQLILAA